MAKLTFAVLMCVFISACVSVGSTQVNPAAAKPKDCELDIYSEAKEVSRDFEVACLLDSRTGTTAFHRRNAEAAVDHARPEACDCGADAMIIEALDTEGATMAGWGSGKAVIRAIRYVD